MYKLSKKNLIVMATSAALTILSSSTLALYHVGIMLVDRNLSNPSTGQAPAGPLTVTVNSVTPSNGVTLDPQEKGSFVGHPVIAPANAASNDATQTLFAAQAPGSSTYSLAINFTTSIAGVSTTNTQTINISGQDTATLSSNPMVSPAGNICNFYLNATQLYGQISFFVQCNPV